MKNDKDEHTAFYTLLGGFVLGVWFANYNGVGADWYSALYPDKLIPEQNVSIGRFRNAEECRTEAGKMLVQLGWTKRGTYLCINDPKKD